jgi:hypothetical protein
MTIRHRDTERFSMRKTKQRDEHCRNDYLRSISASINRGRLTQPFSLRAWEVGKKRDLRKHTGCLHVDPLREKKEFVSGTSGRSAEKPEMRIRICGRERYPACLPKKASHALEQRAPKRFVTPQQLPQLSGHVK